MQLFMLLAAAAGLFMLSSKKQPAASVPALLPQRPASSSKPVAPIPIVPENIVKAVKDAMATLDPSIARKAADALDAQGFHQQAADLRAFATGILNAMNGA